MGSPLYGFPVRRLSGARCKLDAYSGTVLLIVNVASLTSSLAHTATWSSTT
jgi:glutathione peroxidase-family protein